MVRRAALVAALLALAGPVDAKATDVTRDELAALAKAAPSDPGALAELRAVTSVDGEPANVDAALAGAEDDELESRLDQLERSAAETTATQTDADDARETVESILDGERTEQAPIEPPEDDESSGLDVPAPSLPVSLLIALAVLILAAAAARSMGQRTILEREAEAEGRKPKAQVARDLAKEAGEAERRGDYAAAVRLRFQAGLKRLDELGAISLRPSLTASGAVRESGLRALAGLAAAYEQVVFGGRKASAGDAAEQRTGWEGVVAEARERR